MSLFQRAVYARKHAWHEQCLSYRLNFITPEPTQQQINVFLRHLDSVRSTT